MEKVFYCGSDTRAEFLTEVLTDLGYTCRTQIIDGEYEVEVFIKE